MGSLASSFLEQVSIAGYTAGQRAKHVPRGKYVAGVSILVGTGITMFMLVILRVFPFTPRYIIPVAGMMVGNAMTVTGVTMKKLRDDIKIQMSLVYTYKCNFLEYINTTLILGQREYIWSRLLLNLLFSNRWRRL